MLPTQIHGQALKLHGLERSVRMKLMELYSKCGEFLDAERVFGELPERDAVTATILISCYSDQGLIGEARALFDKVHEKDTVCWTAMIDGFVKNGKMDAALQLFREMQWENVQLNEVTIVCVLSACSQLGEWPGVRAGGAYAWERALRSPLHRRHQAPLPHPRQDAQEGVDRRRPTTSSSRTRTSTRSEHASGLVFGFALHSITLPLLA